MNMFLKRWEEIATKRVHDLEHFKVKKKEIYQDKGNVSFLPGLRRDLKEIDELIEINKQILTLIKVA